MSDNDLISSLENDIQQQETIIQKQKTVICNLADTLISNLALTDRLMDEILHLHQHANERLPLDLIAAKDELDKMTRKLLEGHRPN